MPSQSPARRLFATITTAAALFAGPILTAPPAAAQQTPPTEAATVGDLSRQVWTDATRGHLAEAIESLRTLPEASTDPALVRLRSLPELLEQNRAKQSETRASKIAEARKLMEEELAKPETPTTLSAAL